MKKIKILVCSMSPVVLTGLKAMFNPDPQFQAKFINDCSYITNHSDFDLLLIDIDLPQTEVFILLDKLVLKPGKIKIILFASVCCQPFVAKLINYNIDGIIFKNSKPEILKTIISLVYKGEKHFDENIVKQIILNDEALKSYKQSSLTNREIEILALSKQGFRNKQIAEKLFIHAKTVENHKENIKRKLRVKHCSDIFEK